MHRGGVYVVAGVGVGLRVPVNPCSVDRHCSFYIRRCIRLARPRGDGEFAGGCCMTECGAQPVYGRGRTPSGAPRHLPRTTGEEETSRWERVGSPAVDQLSSVPAGRHAGHSHAARGPETRWERAEPSRASFLLRQPARIGLAGAAPSDLWPATPRRCRGRTMVRRPQQAPKGL
jgi:hypothetical protein